MKPTLATVMHCSNLYGSERMTIDTALGLAARYDAIVLGPPGPAIAEARRLGLRARSFGGALELARALRDVAGDAPALRILTTSGKHALVARAAFAARARTRVGQTVVVHGGQDERSFTTKKYVALTGARLLAVSRYVASRLEAHGVPRRRVRVVECFLTGARRAALARRAPFAKDGVRTLAVVARLTPQKRVGLLLDALEREPRLAGLSVRIYGDGPERETLARRARERGLDVELVGFVQDLPARLAEADLLVHLSEVEAFGLSLLEAMASGVPVLVPDAGGAGDVVEDGISGLRFGAGSAEALAARLLELRAASADRLNRIVEGAERALATRFRPEARLDDYAGAIEDSLR